MSELRKRADDLARRSLGLDEEPDKPTPAIWLAAIEKHLQRFPGDDHFIAELSEGRTTGGNGFGTITCMEDLCWEDVILDADPEKPDGGKKDGLGSLFNFQHHCRNPKHIKGRNARLQNAGRPIPPDIPFPDFTETPSVGVGSTSHGPSTSISARSANNHGVGASTSAIPAIPTGIRKDDWTAVPAQTLSSYKSLPPARSTPSSSHQPRTVVSSASSSTSRNQLPVKDYSFTAYRGKENDDRHRASSPLVTFRPAEERKTLMSSPPRALTSLEPHSSLPVPEVSFGPAPLNFDAQWSENDRDLLNAEYDLLYNRSQIYPYNHPTNRRILHSRVSYLQGIARRGPPYVPPDSTVRSLIPEVKTYEDAHLFHRRLDSTHNSSSSSRDTLVPSGPVDISSTYDPARMMDMLLTRAGLDQGMEYERPTDYRKDELEEFFSNALDNFAEDSDVDAALQALNMSRLDDHFGGLTITLMPHQVLGVKFMLEKEKDDKFKGGLLCDAMGLGKTVQTIACMTGNSSPDPQVKTTLIVAPLGLLKQWEAEIESKTQTGHLSIYIHHGSGRLSKAKELKKFDVVLTTYGTMASEAGLEVSGSQNRCGVVMDKHCRPYSVTGPLFRMRFYRVVLDESHTIRNKKTRAAEAAFMLDAVHRWSLTGTLVVNTLDDVHSHLRFLSISPSRDWDHFRAHISKVQRSRPNLAAQRVQAILRTCMLRRNKETKLNGKPLLVLPPKSVEIVQLDFTEEEREMYLAIEHRMQLKFNSFLRKGTVMKHMACVLTMLLRLRQLTCHPYLLRRNPGDAASHPEDFVISDDQLMGMENVASSTSNEEEQTRANKLLGSQGLAFVEKAKRIMKEREDRLATAPIPSKSAKQEKREVEEVEEHECPICFDNLVDEVITPCFHLFCRTCIEEICNTAPRGTILSDHDIERGVRPCPLCREPIEKAKLFRASAFVEPPEEDSPEPPEDVSSDLDVKEEKPDVEILRNGKRKSDHTEGGPSKKIKVDVKGKAKAEPPTVNLDDLETVIPSTKMKYLGELLNQFLSEDGIKVVVFSQFTSYLDLCGAYLRTQNIKHLQYQGSMNANERNDAIKQFTSADEDSPRVILISLKCGGVGLNLTAACKGISLDLAWNAATEMQAFDRLHRIGQTRPVDVKRLVIADTVEQRIMKLQEEKSALADGAMGEGKGAKLGRLSVGDLCRLFGVAR
ncbi:hypothetical protein M231_07232 [Tremella mesenterica]|uniref:DNA repair protein RAD5 n=1 Tax=Tremella mesenterica TaxID=5217 RepID=A0A4V1M336_TREME|nr:hypothetical protein M231_07232 [Tremella mesenterica]